MPETSQDGFRSYKEAINASIELAKQGENHGALALLDTAIDQAFNGDENQFVPTLCHHAAVIARHIGDIPRAKSYYQRSLESNAENPRALMGLAEVARTQGELTLAREYARRAYTALMEGDHFLKGPLLETLLKTWPDVANQ